VSNLVKEMVYEGTVAHLRAQMQRLERLCTPDGYHPVQRTPQRERLLALHYPPDGYKAATGEMLRFREERQIVAPPGTFVPIGGDARVTYTDVTPSTRGSWSIISLGHSEQRGVIEAYEQPDGKTVVHFIDGYQPDAAWVEREPIGAAFAEFVEFVIAEIQQIGTSKEESQDATEAGREENGLSKIERKIIEIVAQLRDEDLIATDERVAARLPPNPKTEKSYHRVTVNGWRIKLREKGHAA